MMTATTATMTRTMVRISVMMNNDSDGDDYNVDGIVMMCKVATVDHQHQLCCGDEHGHQNCERNHQHHHYHYHHVHSVLCLHKGQRVQREVETNLFHRIIGLFVEIPPCQFGSRPAAVPRGPLSFDVGFADVRCARRPAVLRRSGWARAWLSCRDFDQQRRRRSGGPRRPPWAGQNTQPPSSAVSGPVPSSTPLSLA